MAPNKYTNSHETETNAQKSEVHHVPTDSVGTQTLEHKGPRHHVIEQLLVDGDTGKRHIVSTTFPFRSGTGSRGLTKMGIAAGLTVVSLFLLSEINAMPTLATKIYLLTGVGLVAAAVVFGLALRDLFGSLTISSDGIYLTPSVMGFAVPWSALRSWTVRIDRTGGPAVTLKLYGDLPRQIPAGLLSESQLSDVWQILRAQAMSKEAG